LFSNLSPSLIKEKGKVSKRGGEAPLSIISSLSPSKGERDKGSGVNKQPYHEDHVEGYPDNMVLFFVCSDISKAI